MAIFNFPIFSFLLLHLLSEFWYISLYRPHILAHFFLILFHFWRLARRPQYYIVPHFFIMKLFEDFSMVHSSDSFSSYFWVLALDIFSVKSFRILGQLQVETLVYGGEGVESEGKPDFFSLESV